MQLHRPTQEEALAGLRAIRTCLDAVGGPGPAARQMIAAAQGFLLHTDVDLDGLDPIAPEALALAMPRPEIRMQFVQGLTVLGIADGPPDERYYDKVAEFAAAKRRWHRWIDERVDHALQLGAEDPFLAVVRERFPEWNVMVTPGDPTTELLAVLFMAKCQAFLDAEGLPLRCRRVTLQETPTNAVVFEGDPREALPTGLDGWWWRADESIA